MLLTSLTNHDRHVKSRAVSYTITCQNSNLLVMLHPTRCDPRSTFGWLLIINHMCQNTLICYLNRRFPEIIGEDNLTVFSYSGRVKSPEWRWQRREADLRHFEIFRHGPIITYTRLPAGGTCYPICTFPASSKCLLDISDAFSAFCLPVSVIFPTCSLYPPKKCAYSVLHPQAWTYIYRSMPEGSYRVQSPGFPKIVY